VDGDFVSAAKLAAAQAKAAEADGRRRVASAENALRVLIGAPVGTTLPATTTDLTGPATFAVVMPEMSAGVPSDLLLNRPDIQAVERQLDASLAREGAARANYYPRLTLIGDAGWQADPASRVGQGSSGFWSLTPTLTLPIFEGSRNDATLEQAQARFDIARGTYRKAVLNAFREVDDALVDIRELGTQELLAGKVVEAVRERLANAEARAKAGLTNESEVLAARLDLYLARRTLAGYGWERRQAAVRLAAATGGGWQVASEK
jgi:multidrug efflux system outer membrane protein